MKLSQHGIFEDYKVIHDFNESSQWTVEAQAILASTFPYILVQGYL